MNPKYNNNKSTQSAINEAKAYTLQKQAMRDNSQVIVVADNGRELRRLEKIFKAFDVNYVRIGTKHRCREIIVDLVRCSPDGFESLLAVGSPMYDVFIEFIADATFNEAIDFIMEYPRVLSSGISYNKGCLVVGTRMEDLSVFFPESYRKAKRELCRQQMHEIADQHADDIYKDNFKEDLINVDDYIMD